MSSRTARPESSFVIVCTECAEQNDCICTDDFVSYLAQTNAGTRLHECDGCGMRVPADTVTDEYDDRDLCPVCADRAVARAAWVAAENALNESLREYRAAMAPDLAMAKWADKINACKVAS